MTPLRQRIFDDMQVRNLAPHTQRSYRQQGSQFARHSGRSPDLLGPDDIRAYQLHLTRDKHLSASSILVAVAAIRFLYKVTLRRDWNLDEVVPSCRKPQTLPVVMNPEEVSRFLGAVGSPKHRTILTVCYAAGLRVSEAVRLTPDAIDSQRMVIRVAAGKGRKDRYVMLSPRLLDILRAYWRKTRPKDWLFPGDLPGQPISTAAVEDACRQARDRTAISKPVTPHSLRHAFAVHLLESGTNVRIIQQLLGHRSLSTTARYLRIATSKVCATASTLEFLQPACLENAVAGLHCRHRRPSSCRMLRRLPLTCRLSEPAMRIASLALLGCLAAFPAVAQGYYQAPPHGYAPSPAYGYAQPAPDAWASAREEWHRVRRAEDTARWRAANGDYDGANRAQFWADRHRDRARREADVARGRW